MNTINPTPNHPLAEVFGHLTTDFSTHAVRCRKSHLCPCNNKVPSCTKDKASAPLGVCSVFHGQSAVITCPIRFRQDWLITEDAAAFFFPPGTQWTSLTEVRLADADGKSAGNIDIVLVAYDQKGRVVDFGSLEVQAVYISGNVRAPFSHYMENCGKHKNMDWRDKPNYPRPDFLSSSRKRLAPQLMFKGGILNSWNKKMAVATDSSFFSTLPKLREVSAKDADIVWLVYDMPLVNGRFQLTKSREVFTKFSDTLDIISRPKAGGMNDFMELLQAKVDEKLETPPTNQTIENPFKP